VYDVSLWVYGYILSVKHSVCGMFLCTICVILKEKKMDEMTPKRFLKTPYCFLKVTAWRIMYKNPGE
jgi:hypothetical protein